MKNQLVLLFVVLSVFACRKKSDGCMPVAASAEAIQMTTFCSSNNINYTVDGNGIYYQVLDQGSGVKPTANSTITVTYTATTLDGKIVEDRTSNPLTATLNQFIEGLRIALPYIQKGGHIKIVIPSSLAYGCTGSEIVPPNTPLYYDAVLANVQ